MGLFSGLSFWLLYFAPAIIAWYRVKQGGTIIGTLSGIIVINALIGWTVIGWLLMLANAFGINPVAWFVLRFGSHLTTSGPAPMMGSGGAPSGGSSTVPCGQCGASGTVMCSTCVGRGSWYNAPSGEHGVAQLQTCTACAASGRLRCPYCGGSGRVAGPIG